MLAKKVILDTNFLMIPGQFGIDIFSEVERIADFKYKLCFLSGSMAELWKLAKGSGKNSQNAKLAIIMADSKNLKRIKSKDYVDDELVNHAGKGAIIATQDKELKSRIKKINGRIITLKGKKHLILE